jgi:hypothetical protein
LVAIKNRIVGSKRIYYYSWKGARTALRVEQDKLEKDLNEINNMREIKFRAWDGEKMNYEVDMLSKWGAIKKGIALPLG